MAHTIMIILLYTSRNAHYTQSGSIYCDTLKRDRMMCITYCGEGNANMLAANSDISVGVK